MAQDYPDGFNRSLPGHSVDLEMGFAQPWLEETSLTINAGANAEFELEIDDDEHIYYVDSVNVSPFAFKEFLVTVYINELAYYSAVAQGFIDLNPRINPSILFIAGDKIRTYVLNLDASARTFTVKIHGTKIPRPPGYGKVPGAYFTTGVLSTILNFPITFTDGSTYSPTSYQWDYGDGSDYGTAQNPSHIYAVVGSYYPVLKVTNAYGFDTYGLSVPIVVKDVLNFTSFTEVDPGADITIAPTLISFVGLDPNTGSYVYIDRGADYFDDYVLATSFSMTTLVTDASSLYVLGLANAVNDFTHAAGYKIGVACKIDGTTKTLYLRFMNGESFVASDSMTISTGTRYYIVLYHTADSTTVKLYVYSDASLTTLLDTLTVTNANVATLFRYHYVLSTSAYPGDVNWAGNVGPAY